MWPNGFLNITSRSWSSDPRIYLTFDDGPDPDFTPRILDTLASFRVSATFFVLGEACRRHPDVLKRIVAEGHDLGVHADTHRHPWQLRTAQARSEVRDCYQTIVDITGYRPRLFRPPFGRLRWAMIKEAEQLDLHIVLWNRSAIDWGRWGVTERVEQRLAKSQQGDIVLMHDAPREKNKPEVTASLLPLYLAQLHARDIYPRPLSQLLFAVFSQ